MEAAQRRTDSRSRELAASASEVFAAMNDPARIARGWGAAGFGCTIHVFEFTPGGRWSLTMHRPDGKACPNESRFTRIVPVKTREIEHLSGHHFMLTIDAAEVERERAVT